MTSPDLAAATAALDTADTVIAKAIARLAELGGPDANQVFAYELAHAGAGIATARRCSPTEPRATSRPALTCGFAADAIHDLATRLLGREDTWGAEPDALTDTHGFVATYRDPEFLASLARSPGPLHLPDDMDMVRDAFGAFAQDVIAPHAEHVHRTNGDVPEEIISGMAELGAFGLSVPAEYGGYSEGGEEEYLGNGRGHRGAEPREPRYRRIAHHATRDPHPRPR